MGRELKVAARRSLVARPQRLGILPTIAFWNDWEAQRLILPFVIMTAPVLLLINVLQMWLRLHAWISIAANLVIPFLTMGLVERYVRAQVRRRAALESGDARSLVAKNVQASRHAGRALMISMALFSGVLTVLLMLQANAAAFGAAVICGGALIATVLRQSRCERRLAAAGPEDHEESLRSPAGGNSNPNSSGEEHSTDVVDRR